MSDTPTPETDSEAELTLIDCIDIHVKRDSKIVYGDIVLADFARKLERERDAALAANAELLERLQEARESHLIATAKKVQTIQQQSVMMERLASELHGLANMPEHDQDDAHRLRHIAGKALVAYESANPEPIAKPIDEAIKRMEAVPALELNKLHFDLFDYGNFNDIEAVRARLIQAAKGEQP